KKCQEFEFIHILQAMQATSSQLMHALIEQKKREEMKSISIAVTLSINIGNRMQSSGSVGLPTLYATDREQNVFPFNQVTSIVQFNLVFPEIHIWHRILKLLLFNLGSVSFYRVTAG
ncbi:hypothetical protein ACJX0J_016591, partial [Zea mays]